MERPYAQSMRTILKNSESELVNYVYDNQEKFEVQIILTELKKRRNMALQYTRKNLMQIKITTSTPRVQ